MPSIDEHGAVRQADVDIAIQINMIREVLSHLLYRDFVRHSHDEVELAVDRIVSISQSGQTPQAEDGDIALLIARRTTLEIERFLRSIAADADRGRRPTE